MIRHSIIAIHDKTKKRLTALMKKGTTYDQAINVLIDNYKGDLNGGR